MIAYAGWLLGREGFCHDLRMEAIPRGKALPADMLRAARAGGAWQGDRAGTIPEPNTPK